MYFHTPDSPHTSQTRHGPKHSPTASVQSTPKKPSAWRKHSDVSTTLVICSILSRAALKTKVKRAWASKQSHLPMCRISDGARVSSCLQVACEFCTHDSTLATGARASLPGARTLLGAGLTRNKKLLLAYCFYVRKHCYY